MCLYFSVLTVCLSRSLTYDVLDILSVICDEPELRERTSERVSCVAGVSRRHDSGEFKY